MLFTSSPPVILNEHLGRTLRHGGVDVRETSANEVGHVFYGPYAPVTHGVYQVDFSLALGPGAIEGDPVCAIIDVAVETGRSILVQQAVRASDLGPDLRTFSLLFVVRNIAALEYRVATSGAATLRTGVQPTLTRVAGVLDEPPQDGLARTPEDMIALASDTRRLLRPLSPQAIVGHGKVRMGSPSDGGYVCIDDFEGVDTALSFGINDDISWDLDAAAQGLTIYQFDHTVADPAPDDPRMIFEAKRIDTSSGPDRESLSVLIGRHDKGHARPNLILKMDIECAEWDVIEATPEEALERIAWIVCELHYFQGLAESHHRAKVDRCLKKLDKIFATVHVHGNVWGGLTSLANIIFPNVLEATFANRAFYQFADTAETFPSPLDRSCHVGQPDLFLGAFRF